MLSDILREKTDKWIAKKHAATREEGRKEGLAEFQNLLREWNGRRLEAEAKGVPFTEPPPSLD